jgi:hypothetical protein
MFKVSSFALPAALTFSLLLTACGKSPLVAAGPALADGRDAALASALALGKVDPKNYLSVPYDQFFEAYFRPKSAARKALTGKRVQVSCLAEYALPTNEYSSISIQLLNPERPDSSQLIQTRGFAKGLFYFQSRAKKVAWLEERGIVEMSYDGKRKAPAITLFAQVKPATEKSLPGADVDAFTFHAVRRADGKMFSL